MNIGFRYVNEENRTICSRTRGKEEEVEQKRSVFSEYNMGLLGNLNCSQELWTRRNNNFQRHKDFPKMYINPN